MHIRILFSILFSCSIWFQATTVQAQPPKAPQTLQWRPDKKLNWNHFQATSDPSSAYHALSSTGISLSATSKIFRDDIEVDFKIYCFFNPQESWVKSGKHSPALLAHEQLHFDIAEVFTRKLRKQLNNIRFHHRDYQQQIDETFEALLDEMDDIHTRYDRETEHGINATSQAKWNHMVQKKLSKR